MKFMWILFGVIILILFLVPFLIDAFEEADRFDPEMDDGEW